jgi:fluoride exporter
VPVGAVPDDLPIDPDLDPDQSPSRRLLSSPQPRGPIHLGPGVLAVIAVGGFLGGVARYGIGEAFPAETGGFPWATFAVNVSGAFGLALLLVLIIERWHPSHYLRAAVGTGFFGAFTTWSTYMVQTDQLLARGHAGTATTYVLASAIGGLAAAGAGLASGRYLVVHTRRKTGRADRPTRVTTDERDIT